MGGSFSSLCARLQENDPTVGTINTDHYADFGSSETTRQLGNALKNNQHVERMVLDVSNMELLGPDDGVTSIASFVSHSKTLKSVQLKLNRLTTLRADAETSRNNPAFQRQQAGIAKVLTLYFEALASSDSIEEVELWDLFLSFSKQGFLEFLTKCRSNLKHLRLLYGRPVGPVDSTTIKNAFAQNKTLKCLDLARVDASILGACLAGIAMNETLSTLRLKQISHDFDPAPLNHVIETNNNIRTLAIYESHFESFEEFVTSLQRNETIEELTLINCDLDAQEAVQLKRMVKNCLNITRLDLASNSLNDEGLRLLCEGLFRNQTLQVLDISCNDLQGVTAARTLGNLLRRNRGLKRLDVDHNGWADPAAMRVFAQGLARNTSLTSLNLSRSSLTNDSLAALTIFGLRNNNHLTELKLDSNFLDSDGLEILLEAVHESTSLTALSLDDNRLEDDGGVLLGQYLRNPAFPLRSIFLNNTGISGAGVAAIASALETNQQLGLLGLDENDLGEEGINSLCRALRVNATLKTLFFRANREEETEQLHNTLEANAGLTTVRLRYHAVGQPVSSAAMDFFSWRNRCRSLSRVAPTLHNGVWTCALHKLSQRSKPSVIYHVLRDKLPGHCLSANLANRKRQVSS